MQKEFIPYELALELKELGFNEPCVKAYTEEYKTLINVSNHTNTSIKNTLPTKPFTAPLYQQAFRWFREKYNICGWVQESYFRGLKFHQYHISRVKTLNVISDLLESDYNQAELECLKKLIEIVKNE